MIDEFNEPAIIPDMHGHVGEGDLLDPPPLPLNDHDIIEADGLCHGQLSALLKTWISVYTLRARRLSEAVMSYLASTGA